MEPTMRVRIDGADQLPPTEGTVSGEGKAHHLGTNEGVHTGGKVVKMNDVVGRHVCCGCERDYYLL